MAEWDAFNEIHGTIKSDAWGDNHIERARRELEAVAGAWRDHPDPEYREIAKQCDRIEKELRKL